MTSFYCYIDKAHYDLPKYLYPHARYKADPEKNAGKWRFRDTKSGAPKNLKNYIKGAPELIGAAEAIAMVNELYKKYHPELINVRPVVIHKGSLLAQFNKYKTQYKGINNVNWGCVDSACMRFCDHIGDVPLISIDKKMLQEAFDTLTPHTQRNMFTCMSHFFTEWLFDRDYVPQILDNPFVAHGRWTLKKGDTGTTKTNRLRILKSEMRSLIVQAMVDNEQWLVDALKISFLTGLRCADLMNAKWEGNYRSGENSQIGFTISKSSKLNSSDNDVILIFNQKSHPEVMDIIRKRYLNRGVELRGANSRQGEQLIESSKFVFYRKPQLVPKTLPKGKEQICQIFPSHYSKTFGKLRLKCPDIAARMEKEDGYICLHEVRSLFARISIAKKIHPTDIKEALAHKRMETLENHYADTIPIYPKCLVTLADLEGGEINNRFNDFDELEEAIGKE